MTTYFVCASSNMSSAAIEPRYIRSSSIGPLYGLSHQLTPKLNVPFAVVKTFGKYVPLKVSFPFT